MGYKITEIDLDGREVYEEIYYFNDVCCVVRRKCVGTAN